MGDMTIRLVLDQIRDERNRQDTKLGQQKYPDTAWATILGEEFGEACQDALKGRRVNLRKELIQVAAVAVAWVECIDRGESAVVDLDSLQRENHELRRKGAWADEAAEWLRQTDPSGDTGRDELLRRLAEVLRG